MSKAEYDKEQEKLYGGSQAQSCMRSEEYQNLIYGEAVKMISTPLDNRPLVDQTVDKCNVEWKSEPRVPKISKKDRSYLYETIPLKERYEHPPQGFKGDRLQWLEYKRNHEMLLKAMEEGTPDLPEIERNILLNNFQTTRTLREKRKRNKSSTVISLDGVRVHKSRLSSHGRAYS